MSMNLTLNNNKHTTLQMLALAAAVVSILFMWQGNTGFNLWDEGFLWYGAQRVMLGEVPIRDFMAYDPGRYYWSAALMTLWGDNGIMALRVTLAILQAMGLWVGLLLISRTLKKQNIFYLILSAITLVAWMFPFYKMVDISASIFLVGALAYLTQNPTKTRYFFAGLCLGLMAVFGKNHGIYGVVGSTIVIIWINFKQKQGAHFVKGITYWAIGVTVGFLPILFMMLLMPGFFASFLESIRFLFEIKATNLPLPIPWPWRVNVTSLPPGDAIRGILIGLFFIGIIMIGVSSSMWVFWNKFRNKHVPPVLVAASCLALPYAHYAYSRADVVHLALGIFPSLVACLVIIALQPTKIKWPLALMLCISSLWVMYPFQPGWQCHVRNQCVSTEVSGNLLLMEPSTANDITFLRTLADKYAQNGRSFIATPFWPGAYPLLQRKSPLWEIYALFSHPQAFEQAEIERIKAAKPGFVVVIDFPLDGREELRFRNTHPLIHKYILDNFEPVSDSPNPTYQIYSARSENLHANNVLP